MKAKKVEIYDTTLRDGGQQPGISFSKDDKLRIAERLDQLGVDYIELGWPGANEKDSEVFQEAKKMKLKNAKFVAFGMTCGKYKDPAEDRQLAMLIDSGTEIVAIVGKASRRHVEKVLGVSLEENLRLIRESCRFLVKSQRIVFFDAEHFFDGFKQDDEYSLDCVRAAIEGGASRVVLCDTNGGSLPWEIESIVAEVKNKLEIPIGIHVHNDGEMAVACSLAAIKAGAGQVQVTINGYGERCGNANLCSIVPALRAKMFLPCLSEDMTQLTNLARFTAEIANLPLNPQQPYVGNSAFRHKAGLHVNAISKDPESYHHMKPEAVGNVSSVAVSELSGRSNIEIKAKEFGVLLDSEQAKKVLKQVENLENKGFQFEGADGSLKLIMMRHQDKYARPFVILSRDVRSQQHGQEDPVDSAIVKVDINGGRNDAAYQVADGDGPVNALDNALRKALMPSFSYLEKVKLIDYKVRVLPGGKGTAKPVRVLVDFSDGSEDWTTTGCSTDSIEASLQALTDGLEYAILKAH